VASFDSHFRDWVIDVRQVGLTSIADPSWVFVRARDRWGNVTRAAGVFQCNFRTTF
jgi:hypothetical protein